MRENRLAWRDYATLLAFSFLLFGISLVSTRYLTMHEAVLPQSSREMDATGEWIAPLSAGRPWLERPPVPQWLVIASANIVGRFDQEWIVRLPSTLVAAMTVVLVASMATRWYDRTIGLLSGLCLATTFEFTRYAWLAEADIYLCGIVTASIAVFSRIELPRGPDREVASKPEDLRFFGSRSGLVWTWFALLGLTNLAKGLVFGMVLAALPVAAFLIANRDSSRIRRFVWAWGWLLTCSIGLAWPIAVSIRYPDVLDLWKFDLLGRLTGDYTAINEPVWYYLLNLPAMTLPWTPIWAIALLPTLKRAWASRYSADRFLVCWAIVPPLVLSIPGGKHHHYMLSFLAPWAVISALGLVRLRAWTLSWPAAIKTPLAGAVLVGLPAAIALAWFAPKLSGPNWLPLVTLAAIVCGTAISPRLFHHRSPTVAAATGYLSIAAIYIAGFLYTAAYTDECRSDTQFFLQVAETIEHDQRPFIVNADLDSMDVFRVLFYTGDKAIPIHNLSFLRDRRFDQQNVLVLSRAGDLSNLQQFGHVRRIATSLTTRREATPSDRFALFELEFSPDLARMENSLSVSPMQAMDREIGPFLGQPLLSFSAKKRRDAAQLAN